MNEVIHATTIGMLIIVIGMLTILHNGQKKITPGSDCTAPCVVHFQGNMAEDDYRVDYNGHVLFVYKLPVGHP